jgi:hypothetical protein
MGSKFILLEMKKVNNCTIKVIYCILVIALFTCCSADKKKDWAEKPRRVVVVDDCRSDSAGSDINEDLLGKISAAIPLPAAFAHNDFEHKNPLFDALANGFTAIEADVHLINGELYVTHDHPVLVENIPILKELYLDPLLRHIKNNKGQVYAGYNSPIYLMIDIKTDGEATYNILQRQLIEYSVILSSLHDVITIPKPVRIIISGNRPVKTIEEDTIQLAGVDGRLADLHKSYSAGFMPLISGAYSEILGWNGIGTIPEKEFEILKSVSGKVHQQGKKFRLWAAPENENTWKVLLAAGVDFINTDSLEKTKLFLLDKYNKREKILK